jgi:hypothetical protein
MPIPAHQLDTLGIRLGEAWEVFTVDRLINQKASAGADPQLHSKIQAHPRFWNTILAATTGTTFVNIAALLDRNSNSVSLCTVLTKVKQTTSSAILDAIEARLESMRDRYVKLRHKLYGHTDKARIRYMAEFDAALFNWPEMEDDFRFMSYAFKVIYCVSDGKPLPTEAEALRMNMSHDGWVSDVDAETNAFLSHLRGS